MFVSSHYNICQLRYFWLESFSYLNWEFRCVLHLDIQCTLTILQFAASNLSNQLMVNIWYANQVASQAANCRTQSWHPSSILDLTEYDQD